jgi:glycosyltransferase involved in cell wall biosynthesis
MTAPLQVEVAPLLSRRLTGVGRFTARLLEALSRRRPLRLFTALDRDELRAMDLRTDLVRGVEIAVDDALPIADADLADWNDALLRRRQRPHQAPAQQACLYTMLRPPARRFACELSILYDFTPLVVPWCHVESTRRLFGEFFSSALPLSDKAIAISAATKHDAAWLSGIDPDKVVVAYPGASLCVGAHAAPAAAARSADLILVVATREPRKNAAFVAEWFLHSTLLPPTAELCWVGPDGWLDTASAATSPRARRARFRFLGMVPDAELCALYRRAAFTVYPSLYEGFGFPVLDSLRHGTPVLCSYNSALKEFSQPGVFYFDPCDGESLDRAYAALRAAPAPRIDCGALDATYSWERMAATIDALTQSGQP